VRADTVDTNAKGKDPYAYVGDSPENKGDPTGHDGWNLWDTAAAIAVVAATVAVVAIAVAAAPVIATVAAGVAVGFLMATASDYVVNGCQLPRNDQEWNSWGLDAIIGEIGGAAAGLIPVGEIVPDAGYMEAYQDEKLGLDYGKFNTTLRAVGWNTGTTILGGAVITGTRVGYNRIYHTSPSTLLPRSGVGSGYYIAKMTSIYSERAIYAYSYNSPAPLNTSYEYGVEQTYLWQKLMTIREYHY